MNEQREQPRTTVIIENGRVVEERRAGERRPPALSWQQKLRLAALAATGIGLLVFVVLPLLTVGLAILGLFAIAALVAVLWRLFVGRPSGADAAAVFERFRRPR